MSNAPKKRLFIALNLPLDIKDELVNKIKILRHQVGGVKWVNPEGLHITLHFLGNLDSNTENIIKEAMEHLVGKFGTFQFKLGNINAFPNLDRPRVIFIECEQSGKNLALALHKSLGQEILIRAEIKLDERPWTSHITLGRVKGRGVTMKIPPDSPPLGSTFMVDTFDLMESDLKPIGAVYKIIEKFKL